MEAEMDFLFRCVVKSLTVYRYDPLFFFNDTATTEIYTLSLHDALPIYHARGLDCPDHAGAPVGRFGPRRSPRGRGVRHLGAPLRRSRGGQGRARAARVGAAAGLRARDRRRYRPLTEVGGRRRRGLAAAP